MSKLSPSLIEMVAAVERAATKAMRPPVRADASASTSIDDEPCIDELIVVELGMSGPVSDLTTLGFRLRTMIKDVGGRSWLVSGRIPPSRLVELAAISHVKWVETPPALVPMPIG